MLKNKVYIIGVSPFGASSLDTASRRKIQRADMLLGGKRILEMFPSAPGQKVPLTRNLTEVGNLIKDNLEYKRMVVLASGDPDFFGIAGYLIRILGRDVVEIVPGVSSMQLAFARIKESWEEAVFTSVHSRPVDSIIDTVRLHSKVCILTGGKNDPGAIAKELVRQGISNYRVYICQDLGSDKEEIITSDLYHVPDRDFSSLNLMILIQNNLETSLGSDSTGQLLGIPEDRFQLLNPEKSMITKLEVRAVSLAKMRLAENSVIWDIGAGSGAVSIEAASLACRGKVFAIEKNPDDIAVILENVRRFGRRNIEVIQAAAPDKLDTLPSPAAVFIGGSGGRMTAILSQVCRKLQSGGRIVVNVATLENLQKVCHDLGENGFASETVLLNVARSQAVSDLTRLEALNPVFIISAWRRPSKGTFRNERSNGE